MIYLFISIFGAPNRKLMAYTGIHQKKRLKNAQLKNKNEYFPSI
jgi:hypothetical protein